MYSYTFLDLVQTSETFAKTNDSTLRRKGFQWSFGRDGNMELTISDSYASLGFKCQEW